MDKTLTNPNKRGANAAELVAEAKRLDPLGVMPDVGHLLPVGDSAEVDLVGEAKKAEPGAAQLKNRRREQFCQVLTGWGGDGLKKKNHEAYTIVYGKDGATARTQSSWLLSQPDVKARVDYLERKVSEARRHDHRAAQQEIDELRLGLIERGRRSSKLAAVALAAARDYEAAHGLNEVPAKRTEVEVQRIDSDGFGAVKAALVKVMKKEGIE